VSTPQIIAHRGASRERPENTLAAFRRAAELGADAVELDVHRTADGTTVVHHDPLLADGRAITRVTAAQLAPLRVRGEPIPTLEAVLAAVGDSLAVYCELKGGDSTPGAVAVLSASTAAHGRHAVHSFDHRLVAEARRLAPDLARGVLEVSYPVQPVAAAEAVGARDLWRQWEFVDEALVQVAHAAGHRVIAWTVNDAEVMRRFAAIGVDGLCTDDVALARTALAS
jgi:glycerophosphoryl diester phosphodiesterase